MGRTDKAMILLTYRHFDILIASLDLTLLDIDCESAEYDEILSLRKRLRDVQDRLE